LEILHHLHSQKTINIKVPEENILSIEGAGKALNDWSTTSNPNGEVTMLSKTQVGWDRAHRLSTRTIPTIGPLGFALHSPPWRNDVYYAQTEIGVRGPLSVLKNFIHQEKPIATT